MVDLNDSCCSSSLDRKLKRGDTREDGYRFSGYSKKKKADGSIAVYEHWSSPAAFEKNNELMRKLARERQARLRQNPEYLKKQSEYEIQRRKRIGYKEKHNQYCRNKLLNSEYREKRNEYLRQYYKGINDPVKKLKRHLHAVMGQIFKNKGIKKDTKTEKILGCSFSFFKSYIETRFQEGMSWQNRSSWHLDHIIPLATAKTKKELIKLNYYTNFRPLWAKDNLLKSDNLLEEQLNLI
jgi:hypothetical protein